MRAATIADADALVHHRVGMFGDMGLRFDVPRLEAAFRAWLGAMMRKDQTYDPMMTALAGALDGLEADAPARHRLWLMREFLAFVDEEMDGLAKRWLKRRQSLERHHDVAR